MAMEVDSQWQICYDKELESDINAVFSARANMHELAYKDPVTCAAHVMYVDVFRAADEEPLISDNMGMRYTLRESVNNTDAFLSLNDDATQALLWNTSSVPRQARDILKRINNRHMYKSIALCRPSHGLLMANANLLTSDMLAIFLPDALRERSEQFEKDTDLKALHIMKVDITSTASGMNPDENPIDQIAFYNSGTINKGARYQQQTRHTANSIQTYHVVALIVVARMPLTVDEISECCNALEAYWKEEGITDYRFFVPSKESPDASPTSSNASSNLLHGGGGWALSRLSRPLEEEDYADLPE